jgi:hypothetical protein
MPQSQNVRENEIHNKPEQAYDTAANAKGHQQSNYQSPHEHSVMEKERERNENKHAEKQAQLGDTTAEELDKK